MKFNIYNLIVEVPGMQLPLDKGVGGIYSRKAHLSAAADKPCDFATCPAELRGYPPPRRILLSRRNTSLPYWRKMQQELMK